MSAFPAASPAGSPVKGTVKGVAASAADAALIEIHSHGPTPWPATAATPALHLQK